MSVKRRDFLKAASGLVVTTAMAQKVPDPPTGLLVDGGGAIVGNSTLTQLVAGLRAGSWAQLASVANQNSVIGNQPGSSGSLIHFGNAGAWNPLNQAIEILGGDHLGATPGLQHVRYTLATNAFSVIQSAPAVPGIGHVYDHTVVNPFNGDIYHAQYSGTNDHVTIFRKTPTAGSFTQLTNIPLAGAQVTHGAAWWSGAFPGAGAQGCLVVYDCGNIKGQLRAYNPVNGSTILSNDNASPGSSGDAYHTVLEYSAMKNVAVYGGGGANSTKLWRLNANGTITTMPDVPNGAAVGIQLGNFTCDPVSGNFLLLSSGQFWELNPSGSGTWTQQIGTRSPPSGVGDPRAIQGVISCPIPELGAIVYITQTAASGGTFYVYKHT